jgi:MFS family permease
VIDSERPDPKRWIALVVLSSSLFIIVLDSTILNVAVPTIIEEFDTNVSALQWVISGYSLVFASLLISLGRLGDIFGRRKLFFFGATMFAVGSLIASLSQNVTELFIGEALLEGIGAAAMLPATLAIVSATFRGRERGPAFAVWGAVAGRAGALGPWVAGVLTTHYSWRGAFRINVVIAPLAIIAAIFFVRDSRDERANGIDPPGVALVTAGLFAVVFGIIEAGRYGWWRPIGDQSIGGWTWPLDSISIVPVALAVGVVLLAAFVLVEDRRAERGRPVVFDFRDLVHRGFRYGLINTLVLRSASSVPSSCCRSSSRPASTSRRSRPGHGCCRPGRWPSSPGAIGGQLSRRFGPKYVITVGLALEAIGIWLYVFAFSPSTTFWTLLPGLLTHGLGIGFATSQLTKRRAQRHPAGKGRLGQRSRRDGPPGRHRARHRPDRRDLRRRRAQRRAHQPGVGHGHPRRRQAADHRRRGHRHRRAAEWGPGRGTGRRDRPGRRHPGGRPARRLRRHRRHDRRTAVAARPEHPARRRTRGGGGAIDGRRVISRWGR